MALEQYGPETLEELGAALIPPRLGDEADDIILRVMRQHDLPQDDPAAFRLTRLNSGLREAVEEAIEEECSIRSQKY